MSYQQPQRSVRSQATAMDWCCHMQHSSESRSSRTTTTMQSFSRIDGRLHVDASTARVESLSTGVYALQAGLSRFSERWTSWRWIVVTLLP